MSSTEINNALNLFSPVGLEDLDAIRFMNRVDTKFIFPVYKLNTLLERLSMSYKILEIGEVRAFPYHSKYLDSEGLFFYNQHVTGKLSRHKVRYRKYLATGNSFLEIKKRSNKNRTIKWRIESDFEIDNLNDNGLIFVKKHIADIGDNLQTVLSNKFTRITLAGLESSERVTLDFNISFSTIKSDSIELQYLAIAELKSDGYPGKSEFTRIVRDLGIRATGFSKYCIGTALLKDIPRKNILKPKLLLLKKIENEYLKSYCS
jgi:hypothetical protein